MAIVKVENLSKEFHIRKREDGLLGALKGMFNNKKIIKKAVNNISFEINRGEIVGYLGPNGAGKSTTIKMLSGILVPSKGSVEVKGVIPHRNRIENAKNLGVVFGQRTQLWWDIPVSESFSLMKHMYKIPKAQYKENIELFSDILGIADFYNTPVRQLSLGQRMRADLCASLLHNPEILFLDEPTIGLDVVVKEKIRDFIKEINKVRKTTVILTTHDMEDIEKLASRVMVIDNGSIMYDGKLDKLKDIYGTEESIQIEIESPISNFEELFKMGVNDISYEKNKIQIRYDKSCINSATIISWVMKKSKVKDFIVQGINADEVIRKMYKNPIKNLI
ncbi:ABC transporter ATP-binding protein [Dethiothermospora halolimnae]|uniref:ABC transporter ATP-binding protein n=1 Tax=Dethiothermospora halolimnae TaxID=3114390 RepID=UPI003CCBD86D